LKKRSGDRRNGRSRILPDVNQNGNGKRQIKGGRSPLGRHPETPPSVGLWEGSFPESDPDLRLHAEKKKSRTKGEGRGSNTGLGLRTSKLKGTKKTPQGRSVGYFWKKILTHREKLRPHPKKKRSAAKDEGSEVSPERSQEGYAGVRGCGRKKQERAEGRQGVDSVHKISWTAGLWEEGFTKEAEKQWFDTFLVGTPTRGGEEKKEKHEQLRKTRGSEANTAPSGSWGK